VPIVVAFVRHHIVRLIPILVIVLAAAAPLGRRWL